MVKEVNITPDKSLIQKLGLVGYRTEQAIAELIDNSIDARIADEKELVRIHLDAEDKTIVVSDDGYGMNEKELTDAMTIAKGTKSAGRLGQFGIGMKSACSALGENFSIITSKVGSNKECRIDYDEGEWLKDKTKNWQNFQISEKTLDEDEIWHGTRIVISKLRVPIYPNQVSKFKKNFGVRYAPYLQSDRIRIQINTVKCEPEKPDIVEGSGVKIRIKLSNNNEIFGHLSLLKKRSIKGLYGIHLLRNGRLIRAFEKFGFSEHPENSRVVGELNLDHIPVNFNKSAFIESEQYAEAEKALRESPELREMIRRSQSKKEVTASVESVFQYFNEMPVLQHLDGSVPSKAAAEILNKTARHDMKIGDHTVKVRLEALENAPLYTITKEKSLITLVINKNSIAFRFVKNPLFLIGIVASEIKGMVENPSLEGIIQKRNQRFEEFLQEWSQKPYKAEKFRDREPEAPNIRNYGLVNELFEVHEYLKEEIGFKFQFTALSTLSPYFHNLRGKIVYTVHTEPEKGEYLADVLTGFSKFTIAVKPDRNTLNALLNISSTDRIIAIREYSAIKGSSIASPEKAYLDLVNETVTRGIPLDKKELGRIFSTMQRYGLIEGKELKKYAKFIKKTETLEKILGDKLQWQSFILESN